MLSYTCGFSIGSRYVQRHDFGSLIPASANHLYPRNLPLASLPRPNGSFEKQPPPSLTDQLVTCSIMLFCFSVNDRRNPSRLKDLHL